MSRKYFSKFTKCIQYICLICFIAFCKPGIHRNPEEYLGLAKLVLNKNSSNTTTSTTNSVSSPTISYSTTPYIYFVGGSIPTISPTVTGAITSCSISPNLPTGLSISSTDCSISGTPTSGSFSTKYTVTASNSAGSSNTTFTLKIQSTTAIRVYGQLGSFTSAAVNNGGINADSLYGAIGVAIDSTGNTYIGDNTNNRILFYPVGSTTATKVYGQLGNFTTNAANNGGISADSLNAPYHILVDASDNLYIADANNNRVLFYPAGSTTATRVYGQLGSFATNTVNNGGSVTANGLNAPRGLALDSSNNLYIADASNNRVLFYASGSTTPSRVYGQLGSFTVNTANNGGVTANSLSAPNAVILDSNGNLYVADTNNNRVLVYPSGNTTASNVYGQAGSFISGILNNGGTSANSLFIPRAFAMDLNNNLYVCDCSNNRVLYYPAGSTTATRVYGQFGDFTQGAINNGGVSADSLSGPRGLWIDPNGNLFVSEFGNNRTLMY